MCIYDGYLSFKYGGFFMIHMELAPSTLLGLGLTMAGILLYFIRIKQKNISKDYDLFFSSVAFLCGGILIFQGWRLDPILLLCQMMSGLTAIFFIIETLYLRNFNTANQSGDLNYYLHGAGQNYLIKKIIFNKENPIFDKKKSRGKNIINNSLTIDYTLPIDYD
uniref:Hypothetical chloroplast RF66 n=1 Tax=Spirogyra maxima TaxID=3180 RepID=A0A191T4M5_SPIMX|nr:hypothetical chloroplast RF66 [Spirogyra maxima]ANI25337.1 hypothetical chloroplast RF66 [Spirogyra maxima]